MITDIKPLVVIFKEDIATLLHRLQRILLCIIQYNVRIMYKPGPQVFITDWLSGHNYSENWDEAILGMSLNINAIETCSEIPE